MLRLMQWLLPCHWLVMTTAVQLMSTAVQQQCWLVKGTAVLLKYTAVQQLCWLVMSTAVLLLLQLRPCDDLFPAFLSPAFVGRRCRMRGRWGLRRGSRAHLLRALARAP